MLVNHNSIMVHTQACWTIHQHTLSLSLFHTPKEWMNGCLLSCFPPWGIIRCKNMWFTFAHTHSRAHIPISAYVSVPPLLEDILKKHLHPFPGGVKEEQAGIRCREGSGAALTSQLDQLGTAFVMSQEYNKNYVYYGKAKIRRVCVCVCSCNDK